jgi:hypothetical protein
MAGLDPAIHVFLTAVGLVGWEGAPFRAVPTIFVFRGGMVGTPSAREFARPDRFAHPTKIRYRTTPEMNPGLRRGGFISFFRKQCAALPT